MEGLQILEEGLDSKETTADGDDKWMNATDFASVQNPTEWDMLLTRGSGLPSLKDLTRDSLFVKFDPLFSAQQQKHDKEKKEHQNVPPPYLLAQSEENETEDIIKMETTLVKEDLNEETTQLPKEDLNENKEVESAFVEEVPFNSNKPELTLEEGLDSKETTADGDQWVDATDFASVQNPTEWDMLLTRGSAVPSLKDLTRDSLFVKFDPLFSTQQKHNNKDMEELKECSAQSEENETEDIKMETTQLVKEEEDLNEIETTQLAKEDLNEIESAEEVNGDSNKPELEGSQNVEEGLDSKKTSADGDGDQKRDEELKELKERLAKSEKENEDIKMETTVAKEDLNEMESAFAEVLLNYESGKVYQKNFEHNHKVLTTRIAQLELCLARRDEKYDYIEMKANEMTEQMEKEQEARLKILRNENYKLKASLKMSELKVQNLENEIEHIVCSTANLQKLCDEMIQQC